MPTRTLVDPVCGMAVTEDSPLRYDHGGVVYRFCAASCLARFRDAPERFLAGARESMETDPALSAVPHACPMCPGVRSSGPASCPRCGMALEPDSASAGDPFVHEHRAMQRRLALAVALCAPLMVLAMGGMLLGHERHALLDEPLNGWLQGLLASGAVFGAGWPILQRAVASVRAASPNMFTLLGLGVFVAWGASAAALLAPGRGLDLHFESAATVTTLALLGQVLELSARRKTGAALRELLELVPATALVLDPVGAEREIPLAQVKEGFVLRLKPGARAPVDGVVLDGEAYVDESMLTGESQPALKGPGAAVTGGTVVTSGALRMLAERVGAHTVLARIVEFVSRAQRSRAPVQQLVDRVAAWFTPTVIAIAALSWAAWTWSDAPHGLRQGLVAAVSVLVIACPCALGLATPMSLVVAMARAAREGVLFRDADALQRMAGIDTLVVDKTGTLTEGRPGVVRIETAADFDAARLLALAAGVERRSEHPLASAIVAEAAVRGVRVAPAERFESFTGLGARGVVEGREVLVGAERLLASHAIETDALRASAAHAAREGRSIVLVAVDGRCAGWIAVEDPLRGSAREALARLAAAGVDVRVLSGDRRATVEALARELSIEHFEGEASPERKAQVVESLQRAGRRVAMAGDGVNDAPALARADVGVAMGGGTDIAKHSAAVTLVRGDLTKIVKARALARATLRNIRQNLWLAFGYNALCIPLAAGALHSITGWLLSPTLAALAMTFSSLSVILNALRLRRTPLEFDSDAASR